MCDKKKNRSEFSGLGGSATYCRPCYSKRGKSKYHKAIARGLCGVCCKRDITGGASVCLDCRVRLRGRTSNGNRKVRAEVFSHYGNACACCKETISEFLTIDHIGGWGKNHKTKSGKRYGGAALYRWIVKNNFPLSLRILCWNCNLAQARSGPCPHTQYPNFIGDWQLATQFTT